MKPSAPKDIARAIFQKYDLHASVDSVSQLSDLLELHRFKYRTLMQTPGETASRIYYIQEGLVCVFHNDKKDGNSAVVDDFFLNGDILVDADLFTDRPAEHSVKAIEPIIAFSFSYASLQRYAGENRDFNNLLCAILGEYILRKENYIHLLALSPHDRYVEMLQKHNAVIWRSPAKSIASYLRMRSETLSRVRTALNNEDSNS